MSLAFLSHLTPDDQRIFLKNSIAPRRSIPFPVVHHAFEHHAQLQPDVVAVEHTPSNQALTYEQLDKQANRLAHRLRDQGICPGHRVCILARRSVYFVVAVLAVLKSGAQYVPIDAVTITDCTLDHILRDSAPSAVLVMNVYAHRVSGSGFLYLCLEDVIHTDERVNADATKPADLSSPTDGIYVIYTSGTTGVPKGVDVRHNGASNVISASPGNVGMRPRMRVAQLLNIAFDMGAWEILASLYNGCTLCMRGNASKDWVALMKTVDIVICTPSILARHEPAEYPHLKHVIVGGEVCPQALADKWAAHTQFNNCCGPTEISICNTIQPHTPGVPLSIGTPIPNTTLYILDPSSTRALPIGEVGTMWVGGVGVSRGYLNLPDKTAERWRPDPFLASIPSSSSSSTAASSFTPMMFNTGDLARWLPSGQVAHHGRADDQVKIKGFRVELDGVSSAMRAHPHIRDAVALLVAGALWGFVTPSSVDLVVDLASVKEATAKIQPYYAVPSEWVAMEEFPVTKNGKVDKRALGALAKAAAADSETTYIDSNSPVQRLSVRNGGVPFSPSLPGTPSSITEPPSSVYRWTLPGVMPSVALSIYAPRPVISTPMAISIPTSATSPLGPNPGPSTGSKIPAPLQAVHNHLTGPSLSGRKQWTLSVTAPTPTQI